MKKFFKFGKSRKGSTAEGASSSGGLGSRHGSVSSLQVQSSGGYEVREKDMSKLHLHRAAWTGDMTKLTQLIKSNRGTVVDRENR